jgi:predicted nucleic acid-binding protein
MSTVFADAFYFIARLNRRDQHHERVVAFARDCHARLVTTDWVLVEVADALAAVIHARSTPLLLNKRANQHH